MAETKCFATKKSISNDQGAVIFPCPMCGEPIVRSSAARLNVAKYTCNKCQFQGP